jgi:hypothetical protein
LYPLIGGPPVWSTENREDYESLLDAFTQMLQPRDLMEYIWVKEAADATWEEAREASEKNGLPERNYQQRLKTVAQHQRPDTAKATLAKVATASDLSRGFLAGFKLHQGLDIGQSRKSKRRAQALRQIERWRDGFGTQVRTLSDQFVNEQILAQRYGVNEFLARNCVTAEERTQATPSAPIVREPAEAAPPLPFASNTPETALACEGDAAETAPPISTDSEAAETTTSSRAAGRNFVALGNLDETLGLATLRNPDGTPNPGRPIRICYGNLNELSTKKRVDKLRVRPLLRTGLP